MLKYQKAIKLCLILFHMLFFQNVVMAASFGYIMITDPDETRSNYLNIPALNSVIPLSKSQIIFYNEADIQNIAKHYKNAFSDDKCVQLTLAQSQLNYISDAFGEKCGLSSSGLILDKNYYILNNSSKAKILSYNYLGTTDCEEFMCAQKNILFALIMLDYNDVQ